MDKNKEISIAFHDLLNYATSIRNLVYILLTEKTQPDKQAKDYLKGCLTQCNKLIKALEKTHQKWPKEK